MTPMTFSPARLNHAVLSVADFERAERFFTNFRAGQLDTVDELARWSGAPTDGRVDSDGPVGQTAS